MADYPILTSPDGSTSINVGSVMLADGVDYGMAGMFTNGMGGNPFVDGGNLGFRFSGPRMFKFPIRLATVGNMSPAGVAKTLALIAQPGAWVDLMLSNAAGGQVATADAVRFDVIDGRVRQSQDVKMWAGAGRREGVLELDVQPYGYSPTWIILASVPSIALPGRITIPGASIIGDVPGLAQISAWSNLPSQQLGGIGTYGYDAFFYSMGNKSQQAFIPAASITWNTSIGGVSPTILGDAAAPGSQTIRVFINPSVSAFFGAQIGWQQLLNTRLNPSSSFGRYRVHAFARMVVPSYGGAIAIAADMAVDAGANSPTGFATGGLLASVGQPLTLASDGAFSPIPTGFGFFPLGDITIPTTGASAALMALPNRAIRIWGNVPSFGLPTLSLDIAGLWMQSLDGANGVITRDLQNNNAGSMGFYGYSMFPFTIDAAARDVQAAAGLPNNFFNASVPSYMPLSWMGSQMPIFSLADRYRGVYPQVTPSMTNIEIMLAARRELVSYRNEVLTDTPKAWWRFNEPSGASTIVDWSGNGVNAVSTNLLLGASSLLYGEPGDATHATGFGFAANAALPVNNAPKTLEAWFNPATYAGNFQVITTLGASDGAAQTFGLSFNPTSVNVFSISNAASWAYAWVPGLTYHLAAAYSGTFVQMYVNGQGLGTTSLPAATPSVVGRLNVGDSPQKGGNRPPGGIGDISVYASALSAARVLAHYVAGRNTQGATSPPVYHQGGYAGVSVRYQPRFTFQKEF